jgi:hypothetical protein
VERKGNAQFNFRKKDEKEREDDVQDGHVTEEDTNEQRTDRSGYHGAVHAPRRWLLEYTRFSCASREQVTTRPLSSQGKE